MLALNKAGVSNPEDTFNLTKFAPVIQTYIAQSGTRTTTLAVTLPAITQIYILVNATDQTGYNLSFNVEGGTEPDLVLENGVIATVLSDGSALYSLTQTSTGSFRGVNGTAGTPTFSFNSDTHTGMYLPGTSILGFAANG